MGDGSVSFLGPFPSAFLSSLPSHVHNDVLSYHEQGWMRKALPMT